MLAKRVQEKLKRGGKSAARQPRKTLAAWAVGLCLASPSAWAGEPDLLDTTASKPKVIAKETALRRCPRCGTMHGSAFACPCEQPKYFSPAPTPGAAEGDVAAPQDQAAPAAAPENQLAPQPFDDVASNFGATSSSQSVAPFMIGDSFGGGGQLIYTTGSTDTVAVDVGGGGNGAMKIADNSSPLPRCRAFVNYNFFSNAVRSASNNPSFNQALDVNRYIFGYEQCFADSRFSVEVRVPFSSTINSNQYVGDPIGMGTQFGHVTTTFKALLLERENWALTGGLSLNIPSSNNFRVLSGSPATTFLQVNDQSIHLLPYLGYLATPSERLFVQAFAQLDFDTRGNNVLVNDGSSLSSAGTVQDQTLLYLDASIGYWIYRNDAKQRGITGIAPMLELHYTTTLQNADVIYYPGSTPSPLYGNFYNRYDVLNMTAGVSFMMGQRSYLTLAGISPLTGFPNRFFNGEAAVLYNYMF